MDITICNILVVELTLQNKVKIKTRKLTADTSTKIIQIPEYIDTIEFVDDCEIIFAPLQDVEINYIDFILNIPKNINNLLYSKLSDIYTNSKLYDNLPTHITHITTNMKGNKDGVYPILSNLPYNLKKLSIANLNCEYKINNKVFKLSCNTINILENTDECFITHQIKVPHKCIFECNNKHYDSIDNLYFKLQFDYLEDNYKQKFLKYKQKYLNNYLNN